MTKIKYIGISNSMNSKGIQYHKNVVYEVKDEVAEYFIKNFNTSFEIINAKSTPKEEVKVIEPVKEEVKVVKKPTRKPLKKAPKE